MLKLSKIPANPTNSIAIFYTNFIRHTSTDKDHILIYAQAPHLPILLLQGQPKSHVKSTKIKLFLFFVKCHVVTSHPVLKWLLPQ
jgi:hypothetical protein